MHKWLNSHSSHLILDTFKHKDEHYFQLQLC